MKQLKFMLATAAVIGLVGAAQAGTTEKFYERSTDFESTALTSENGFTLPTDNYSEIIAGTPSGVTRNPHFTGAQEKVLSVDTGTEPILLTLKSGQADSITESVPAITIDTLVQFTVTPDEATPAKGDNDKFMLYLKQKTAAAEGVAATYQLYVKCNSWTQEENFDTAEWEDKFAEVDVPVTATDVIVAPNAWYRLTVKTEVMNGVTVFSAQINGVDLKSVDPLAYGDATAKYFPSLEPRVNTISAVGFAGEGLVDDLAMSYTEVITSLEFTITYNNSEISSVQYTIDNGTPTSYTSAFAVNPGQVVKVIPTFVDPWAVLTVADTYTVSDSVKSANLTTKVVAADNAFTGDATATAVAESLGIKNEAFKGTDAAAQAALTKAITWAKAYSYAPAKIDSIAFTGNEANGQTAEAYLLNVADDATAVANKKEAFVFSAITFDTNGDPVVTIDPNFTHNGTVTIMGATALDDENAFKNVKASGDKFFKAVLTK